MNPSSAFMPEIAESVASREEEEDDEFNLKKGVPQSRQITELDKM